MIITEIVYMNSIKNIMQVTMLVATIMIAACTSPVSGNHTVVTKDTEQTAKASIDFSAIHFASKKDTSCGMPLSAGLEDTVQMNNKVYGFCSKECKDDFVNKIIAQHKR